MVVIHLFASHPGPHRLYCVIYSFQATIRSGYSTLVPQTSYLLTGWRKTVLSFSGAALRGSPM